MLSDELARQLVRADLVEDRVDGGDLLDEPLLGGGRVDDVEHEIGDERLLERRGEALDELVRQAPDEADGVGDEVAAALVLEAARRRVERLEQPVADGDAGVGERVEERRLAGVRVAGERDRRRLAAAALLAADVALAAEAPQPLAEQRDAAAREAAVGLELRLAGAARADAAAEPLEVLPHPAHARQVVLELRELDLELALGADGVLGEDVEDQLRAVDDARLERVLERALLRRAELVVDDEHLRLGVSPYVSLSSSSFPLPTNVRGSGRDRCWTTWRDGLDARRARELLELGDLVGRVGAGREHGEDEPALGLGRRRAIGLFHRHPARHYDACRAVSRPRRPHARARRHPSESRHEREAMELVRSLLPGAALYDDGEAIVWGDPAAPVALAGHVDTVPAQGNIPGRIDDGAVHGLGASDMKGGVAVMLELARAGLAARYVFFTREEVPLEESPLPAVFASGVLARSRARRRARADGLHPPRRLPREPPGAGRLPRRERALGAAVDGRQRDPRARRRARAGSRALEPLRRRARRARLPRGAERRARRGRDRAERRARRSPRRSSTSASRRAARATRPRRGCASSSRPESCMSSTTRRPRCPRSRIPLVARLRELVPDVAPKQAWTPVAQFAEQGIDAINYGPGATAYAHKVDEQIPIENLHTAYDTLARFLS